MQKWARWEDWVAVVVGVVVALSAIVIPATGASLALMLILGILLIVAGVAHLVRPRLTAMEWSQGALGILLFIAPWLGGYSSSVGAAWVSWAGGVVTVAIAVLALQPAARVHHHGRIAH
ncbi:MAG: hypothetical protein JWP75_316 [Frondihabitans sp.]|nr:hypothetical protein [Frondihabitans sp.]